MTDTLAVTPLHSAELVGRAHAVLDGAMGHGWWSPETFAADVAAPNRIWLAVVDDGAVARSDESDGVSGVSRSHAVVVGVAGAMRVAAEAELLAIGVAQSHRGRGIARRLLLELAAAAAAGGADRLFLEVRAGNDAARALYRSVGLRRTGRRPGYYANGEDAILLAADLTREGTRASARGPSDESDGVPGDRARRALLARGSRGHAVLSVPTPGGS